MIGRRVCLGLCVFLAGTRLYGAAGGPGGAVFTSSVRQAAGGFRFTEGPVWLSEGAWLFSDIPANRIYRLRPGGEAEVWRDDSGQSNGLTLDREGALLACEHGNRRVSRTPAGGKAAALVDRFEGKRFNSPNDLAVRADGLIVFTDPTYGLRKRPKELPCNGVYAVRPGNEPHLLVDDFDMPNGIAFSPDEKRLYVADTALGHVRVFEIDANGALSNGRVFGTVGTPDGMKVDTSGRLFVTSSEGIVVFNANGTRAAVLRCPERPANCAFGGGDGRTLLITARKGVYTVRVATPGIVPASQVSQGVGERDSEAGGEALE